MTKKLEGSWDAGLAFDNHTLKSTCLGPDETGRQRFDTVRSEMGELVYQLKYQHKPQKLARMMALLDTIKSLEKFDFMVPIPPTDKSRSWQPVTEIVKALGKRRNVPVLLDLLKKKAGGKALKDITDDDERIEALEQSLTMRRGARIEGCNVLLIDDLYRSGATLSVATNLLRTARPRRVCVLTMTKTRSNR